MAEMGAQYDRVAPAWTKEVLRKFGQNPHGENIFRIVWGAAQTEVVGGMWHERAYEDNENRMYRVGNMLRETNPELCKRACYKTVPKTGYGDVERWVLEKWRACPYSPAGWYMTFQDPESGLCRLGPYPEHGEYWMSYRLEMHGEFMDLSAGIIEYYARLVDAGSHYSETERRLAIEKRHEREMKDWENRFDGIYDEAQLAGGTTNIFSAVSGPKSKDRLKPEDVQIGEVPDSVKQLGLDKPGFFQMGF